MIFFGLVRRVMPLIAVVMLGSVLTACSMTTKTEAMIPEDLVSRTTRHADAVGLMVSGESGGITIENFTQAVADAVVASGAFARIDNGAGVPYLLDIQITEVRSPLFGGKMTVSMNSTWRLFRTADRTALMDEKIQTSYTGGAFEGGFVGANRVRVATEGTARETIRVGVRKIVALDTSAE